MRNGKNDWNEDSQGEEGGRSGKGGKSGDVDFRFKTETYRDDQLPPSELKRLLEVHVEIHKAYVDKQKALRKERLHLKENPQDPSRQHRAGYGAGGSSTRSTYKKHPISNKAQFSGMDRQVSALPTENEISTNLELRNKLENRYNHNFQPKRQFNPKPRPY